MALRETYFLAFGLGKFSEEKGRRKKIRREEEKKRGREEEEERKKKKRSSRIQVWKLQYEFVWICIDLYGILV